ncbi:hypothetical protein ABH289_08435 [Acinetobacter pittii]|uniref:hypothetical protein n=1 Tax=Acinetobacter calcoaceticus/baumannii complex TaxID=909768 RepID=UPI0032618508
MNEQQAPSIDSPRNIEVDEVIKLLIKQCGIHEGHYILNFELEIAAGQMPLPSDQNTGKPSIHFALTSFSLQKVPAHIPNAVDASVVNPIQNK